MMRDIRQSVTHGVLAGLLVLAVLFVLGSCVTPGPTPPPPNPIGATCATACARGTALGCSWARPTHLGSACDEVCQNAATRVPWNLACLTTVATCAEADTCP